MSKYEYQHDTESGTLRAMSGIVLGAVFIAGASAIGSSLYVLWDRARVSAQCKETLFVHEEDIRESLNKKRKTNGRKTVKLLDTFKSHDGGALYSCIISEDINKLRITLVPKNKSKKPEAVPALNTLEQ